MLKRNFVIVPDVVSDGARVVVCWVKEWMVVNSDD